MVPYSFPCGSVDLLGRLSPMPTWHFFQAGKERRNCVVQDEVIMEGMAEQ
jgi:hypothetical protein